MNKNQTRLLLPAIILCALSLLGMVLALTLTDRQEVASFTPPPFDATAQAGTPTVPEELGWSELDAQAFQAGVCGVFAPQGDTVDVWLTNPENNAVWLKLRVLDEKGNVLGETGLLRPGEYVQSVTLTSVPNSGTPLTLKLMAYEPDTYHSAGAVSLRTTVE